MKPTFQKASEDLKQTSILHSKHTRIKEPKRAEVICFGLFIALTLTWRAVEFFIRDKYEKKKYYGKNVTNGSSVCIH